MRSYNCYVFHMKDGKLVQNNNQACWAGISKYMPTYYSDIIEIKLEENIIYIKDYKEPETEQWIDLIVRTINEITPCEFVNINNIEYIKYNLLGTYDQNLILLNFIRNLWCQQNSIDYNIEFFIELAKLDDEDALVRLTAANIVACKGKHACGHSNMANASTLKLKTKEQLLAYKGTSTNTFLIT